MIRSASHSQRHMTHSLLPSRKPHSHLASLPLLTALTVCMLCACVVPTNVFVQMIPSRLLLIISAGELLLRPFPTGLCTAQAPESVPQFTQHLRYNGLQTSFCCHGLSLVCATCVFSRRPPEGQRYRGNGEHSVPREKQLGFALSMCVWTPSSGRSSR